MQPNLKLMTVLLFIYNSLLGFAIALLTKSEARIVLLVLIAVDYFILFYYFMHVADKLERDKLAMKMKIKKPGKRSKAK